MIDSIRALCKSENITPTKLEEKLGFSQGLISRWKDKNPNLDRIVDIADYFHVSVDEVIGRDENNINDDFLEVLYKRTSKKEILWKSFDKSNDESGIKEFIYDFDSNGILSFEDYEHFEQANKQISYYFEYYHGYVSMFALYEYHNIAAPKELKLFIQPDIKAELIPQSYDTDKLLPLWLKVLTSLNDNAPDEIKAEDLKQQMIKESKNVEDSKDLKQLSIYDIDDNII